MPPPWFRAHEKSDKDKSRNHIFRRIFRRKKKQQNIGPQDYNNQKSPPQDNVEADHQTNNVDKEAANEEGALTEDTLEALFYGAPHFSVKNRNGRDVPVVAFPYDEELAIRDASDCVAIEQPAYSASTAYSHLAPGHSVARHAPEYAIGIFEVPNMLTARGNEPGTVGFSHFLEESVSDLLEELDQVNSQADVIESFKNEDLLNSNPEELGIRSFNIEFIGKRLIELGAIYREYQSSNGRIHLLKKQTSEELHSALFNQLLVPPKAPSNAADPADLKVQIEVLLNTLNLKAIWYDFSLASWRLKVGELLWTGELKPNQANIPISDREVLILQIILSCELLLRLDAVAAVGVQEVESEIELSGEDISKYHSLETKKSKWDLMLARCFLRNIEVRTKPLLSSLPFLSMPVTTPGEVTRTTVSDIAFCPIHLEQQISGLFHFAKTLQWQDADAVEGELRGKLGMCGDDFSLLAAPSVYGTPLSSPRSMMSQRSSYFDTRPELGLRITPQVHLQSSSSTAQEYSGKTQAEESQNLIGGWLTLTYMTGLVFPGESISHLLISALLENDSVAISRLGDSASLYGGFSYRNRSCWWSKACIVGRVMAALHKANECMGWIYIPGPNSKLANNTWFEIHCVMDVPRQKIPRIRQSESVSADSDFFANKAVVTVSSDEFIMPVDPVEHPTSNMWFEDLHLEAYDVALHDTPRLESDVIGLDEQTRSPPQLASLHFRSSPVDQDSQPSIEIPLFFLVNFISAFPCFPPSPTILSPSTIKESSISAHVLHKSHTYKIVSALELFTNPSVLTDIAPVLPEHASDSPQDTNNAKLDDNSPEESTMDRQIFIVDSRGDATLDMFARAWCAWKGLHALVARVKVTCLACAVREARALGIRVVIRVE